MLESTRKVLSYLGNGVSFSTCFNSGLGQVEFMRLSPYEVRPLLRTAPKEPFTILVDRMGNVHISTPLTTLVTSYNERFKTICEGLAEKCLVEPLSIFAEDGCMCIGAMIEPHNLSKTLFSEAIAIIESAACVFRDYLADFGYDHL